MSKRTHVNIEAEDSQTPSGNTIICEEPPCTSSKIPIEIYLEHVQQYHEHRCEACGGNFVTERLLELHQDELHNPFDLRLPLKCFEANCTQEFKTQDQRIHHLHVQHSYPDSFDFNVVSKGYTVE